MRGNATTGVIAAMVLARALAMSKRARGAAPAATSADEQAGEVCQRLPKARRPARDPAPPAWSAARSGSVIRKPAGMSAAAPPPASASRGSAPRRCRPRAAVGALAHRRRPPRRSRPRRPQPPASRRRNERRPAPRCSDEQHEQQHSGASVSRMPPAGRRQRLADLLQRRAGDRRARRSGRERCRR